MRILHFSLLLSLVVSTVQSGSLVLAGRVGSRAAAKLCAQRQGAIQHARKTGAIVGQRDYSQKGSIEVDKRELFGKMSKSSRFGLLSPFTNLVTFPATVGLLWSLGGMGAIPSMCVALGLSAIGLPETVLVFRERCPEYRAMVARGLYRRLSDEAAQVKEDEILLLGKDKIQSQLKDPEYHRYTRQNLKKLSMRLNDLEERLWTVRVQAADVPSHVDESLLPPSTDELLAQIKTHKAWIDPLLAGCGEAKVASSRVQASD